MADREVDLDLEKIAPYAIGAGLLGLLYWQNKNQRGLFAPGGLLSQRPKGAPLTQAQIAALQQKHAAAVQQGNFAAAAQMAGQIAQSQAANTLAQGLVSGLSSLFSASKAASSVTTTSSDVSSSSDSSDSSSSDGGATPPQPGDENFVGPVQPPPAPGDDNFVGPLPDTSSDSAQTDASAGDPAAADPMQTAVDSTPEEEAAVSGIPFENLHWRRAQRVTHARRVMAHPDMRSIAGFQAAEGLRATGHLDHTTQARLIARAQGR